MYINPSRAARACISKTILALTATLPGTLLLTPSMAAPTFVAQQGAKAPGGGTFGNFSTNPVINNEGIVAFTSTLTGGTAASGLFAGIPDALQAVALQGTSTPLGGNLSGLSNSPVINDLGQLTFIAPTVGGSSTQGLFVQMGTALSAVALAGNAAPSAGAAVFSTFVNNAYALNDAGQVAFRANLTGGTSSSGLFLGSPGSVQAIALAGNSSPVGGKFNSFTSNPVLNDSGTVAFTASMSGTTSTAGLFVGTPGSVQAVAIQGAVAPTGSGASFNSFTNPMLNSAGQVAFASALTGGVSGSGIFAGISGSVQAVALQGAAAPGGGTFGSLSSSTPVINALGQIAFSANLAGGTTSGLFLGTPGLLSSIALPGTLSPTGALYNTVTAPPVLNAAGQLVFTATLTGEGVTTSNDTALFAYSDGTVFTLLREGDLLDVNPSDAIEDLRRVATFSFASGTSGDDGRFSALSDSGYLAYRVTFVDNSSAVVISAIPEPSSFALITLAGAFLLNRRAFRRNG